MKSISEYLSVKQVKSNSITVDSKKYLIEISNKLFDEADHYGFNKLDEIHVNTLEYLINLYKNEQNIDNFFTIIKRELKDENDNIMFIRGVGKDNSKSIVVFISILPYVYIIWHKDKDRRTFISSVYEDTNEDNIFDTILSECE